jgi:hypothetical protein
LTIENSTGRRIAFGAGQSALSRSTALLLLNHCRCHHPNHSPDLSRSKPVGTLAMHDHTCGLRRTVTPLASAV